MGINLQARHASTNPALPPSMLFGSESIGQEDEERRSRKAERGRELHMPFVQGIYRMHEAFGGLPVSEVI